jgi:hypothetical protein
MAYGLILTAADILAALFLPVSTADAHPFRLLPPE